MVRTNDCSFFSRSVFQNPRCPFGTLKGPFRSQKRLLLFLKPLAHLLFTYFRTPLWYNRQLLQLQLKLGKLLLSTIERDTDFLPVFDQFPCCRHFAFVFTLGALFRVKFHVHIGLF